MSSFEICRPLAGASFGGLARLVGGGDAGAVVAAAEAEPQALPRALAASQGLLLLKGLDAIAGDASLLLRLSQLFGPEIEDYRSNLTPLHMVHPDVPEILIVSNAPPVN